MSELQKARTGSELSSAVRTEHRTWIKGRAATLLAHYWREDDDPALLAAIGKDWADVLEGLPAEYVQRACIQYQRDEPKRRPTPGAIYQMARALMPKPKTVPVMREIPRQLTADEIAERDAVVKKRRAEAAQIINEFGFRARIGGHNA